MRFENLLKELRSTSKPKEKAEVLVKYACWELEGILWYTLDPFVLFNVTIKDKDINNIGSTDLSECIEEMSTVLNFCIDSKSHKQNKIKVLEFISTLNAGSQELFMGILNKNWKVGVSSKTIKELYPELLREFNVQLANKYIRGHKPHSLLEWIVSYKLDGLRCVALRDEYTNEWSIYSRTGKKFTTVDYLKPQLETLYNAFNWTFFDGELYRHGLSFEEIQGQVMSSVNKKEVDVEYHVFVCGQADGFLSKQLPSLHIEVPVLREADLFNKYTSHIRFVENRLVREEDIEAELERALEAGYEGIMLRNPDYTYDYRRSNNLLKLKSTLGDNAGEEVSDCVIIDLEYNDAFPVIKDGMLYYERLINKLLVLQENEIICKVGSGFDMEFRHKDPDTLIDKVIEVQHQGFGTNGRMRFPRFKRIREDL